MNRDTQSNAVPNVPAEATPGSTSSRPLRLVALGDVLVMGKAIIQVLQQHRILVAQRLSEVHLTRLTGYA